MVVGGIEPFGLGQTSLYCAPTVLVRLAISCMFTVLETIWTALDRSSNCYSEYITTGQSLETVTLVSR